MKKSIICIIFLSMIICGCSNHININIKEDDVINIVYNETPIYKGDYKKIIEAINTNNLYELFDGSINGKKLEIKTNEFTYQFEIINNYIIYSLNDKRYFKSIDGLNDLLSNTVNKDIDNNFFTVDMCNSCQTENANYLIAVDNSRNYIEIKSDVNIYTIEIYNNNILTGKINNIDNNEYLYIECSNPNNMYISFYTPFNEKINITYNSKFIISKTK